MGIRSISISTASIHHPKNGDSNNMLPSAQHEATATRPTGLPCSGKPGRSHGNARSKHASTWDERRDLPGKTLAVSNPDRFDR